MLEAFLANEPVFELSSLMPAGFLPMPVLPAPGRAFFQNLARVQGEKDKDIALFEILQKYKKFRKAKWLPVSAWLIHKNSLSAGTLFIDHNTAEKADFCKIAFEPHVSIDRQTSSAMDGQLFFTRMNYFDKNTEFHLYARTKNPDWLEKYLHLIGEMGFGQNTSTGNGQFETQRDIEFAPEKFEEKEANASLLLSTCAAQNMEELKGYYHLEVKRGKTGPAFSNPFKNPFLMLQEGSLLTSPLKGPFVLTNINEDSRIVQITQALTLPCAIKLEENE